MNVFNIWNKIGAIKCVSLELTETDSSSLLEAVLHEALEEDNRETAEIVKQLRT